MSALVDPHDHGGDSDDADVVQVPASVFFTDKGALVASRLGDVIKTAGHVEAGVDGRLYRYHNGVYRADGDLWARGQTRILLQDRWAKRHGEEIAAWLRSFEPTITDQPNAETLNVANGLLNWRNGQLRPHSPDEYTTIQIGARWDPGAVCPNVDRFLAEVLPTDAGDLIDEIIGYTLYPGNPLRSSVLFLGPGRNGKGRLLDVIKGLAGPGNVSAIPLQVLAENRFAAAELFGKLANVCGDLDARAVRNTDVFKMATGGDALMAERKHGQPFTFVPFASFLFAANEAPITSDQTDGWFDRWLVIPMERRIPDDQVDPHILRKLTTPAELSGLLNRAVHGLQSLMERGRFVPPGSVAGAGEQYRDRLDTVRGFVGDECVIHPEAHIERTKLYRRYRSWATDSGRLPVSAINFNDHIRRGYPMRVEERTLHGIKIWQGLGLLAGRPGD